MNPIQTDAQSQFDSLGCLVCMLHEHPQIRRQTFKNRPSLSAALPTDRDPQRDPIYPLVYTALAPPINLGLV
jgi:hypothetical protein